MDLKALQRERALALLTFLIGRGATEHGAAKRIDLDPSIAGKLRRGERKSIGATQIEKIVRKTGIPREYFSSPTVTPGLLERVFAERTERESVAYTAMDELLKERRDGGRPVTDRVADLAQTLYAAGGAATRIEAIQLLESAATIVTRLEGNEARHPDAPPSIKPVRVRPRAKR
jgi:NH3-dependent NAD+ synthetase